MARVFYGVRPDAVVGERLAALAAALRSSGKPVPAENYHLTLAFVGEVPAARLDRLRAIGAALHGERCTVRLDALTYWRPARVLVLAARESPQALVRTRARLIESLEREGLEIDAERFQPHVTLARKVLQAPVASQLPALEWTLRELSLLASDTSGQTSRYTVLGAWPLLDA